MLRLGGNGDRLFEIEIFRPAVVGDFILAGRQQHFFAVGPVNLIVEEEVGREPPRLRRIDAAVLVAKDELPGRRRAVVVEDRQLHAHGRLALEEDRHFVAKADVLRSLADVEADRRFALALVAAVDLHDAIFEVEAGELGDERLIVEHLDVHPAVGHVFGLHGRLRIGAAGGASVERRGVGTGRPQVGGHAAFVVDLDEEDAPALLDELCRGCDRGRLSRGFRD